MKSKFNKIVENVFIPADDEDVAQRKKEHYRIREMESEKFKKEFEENFGPLKPGDIIHTILSDEEEYYEVIKISRFGEGDTFYENPDFFEDMEGFPIIYLLQLFKENGIFKRDSMDEIFFGTWDEVLNDSWPQSIMIGDIVEVINGAKIQKNLDENIFIPADDDEVTTRKDNYNKKTKIEFEKKHGPLKQFDKLHITSYHNLGDSESGPMIHKVTDDYIVTELRDDRIFVDPLSYEADKFEIHTYDYFLDIPGESYVKIERKGKILENIFIPADDADLAERKVEFARIHAIECKKNKERFEKIYGKIKKR